MASADNTSGLYSVPQVSLASYPSRGHCLTFQKRLEPIPQGNFSQPFSADSTRYSDSTRTLCPTNTFDHIQPHTPYNSMPIPSTDATMTLNNFGFIPQYSTLCISKQPDTLEHY
ncbi:hypothetical protein BD410DRAFT_497840 [Rickenella mellea]|uniref:Uncharacterized protein n=1 Tax=Rickenella mellea TaxID=50990 RepID=A0A4Y7PSZ3_9AGAM|nr:hypothetical protein BD410DRAFT_497840 [Rickenella mellea]